MFQMGPFETYMFVGCHLSELDYLLFKRFPTEIDDNDFDCIMEQMYCEDLDNMEALHNKMIRAFKAKGLL